MKSKKKGRFRHICAAFLEYMNFTDVKNDLTTQIIGNWGGYEICSSKYQSKMKLERYQGKDLKLFFFIF